MSREQILGAVAVTAIALLIASRLWLVFDQSVGMLPLKWSGLSLLWGIGIGIGITCASAALYRLWDAYRQSADFYLAFVLQPLNWFDLIWLGLLPGLSEEMLFRGVMLPAIGLNWYGVTISSLCFGVLHFSGAKHWAYVIWTTIVGFLLGWSALATGNLLVPILAHVLTNLVSALLWKFALKGDGVME